MLSKHSSAPDQEMMLVSVNSQRVLFQIGLVGFNDQVFRPPGLQHRTCYYNHLAFATSDNKDYFVTWLNDITGASTSDYKLALSAAFTFFTETAEVRGDSRPRSRCYWLGVFIY